MSTSTEPTAAASRQLTHAEFVYRPGERHLAAAFFELIGCRPADRGGEFLTSFIEPAEGNYSTNTFYASEVTAEQWQLEQSIASDSGIVGAARRDYLARLRREPQRSFHIGFKVPTEEALDSIVARVNDAAEHHPELAARVNVAGVYRPGEDGAIAPNMVQAFIWTDVVAAGLLALGQHVEVQWHLPVSPT